MNGRTPSFFILEDNAQDRTIITAAIKKNFPGSKISTAVRLSECLSQMELNAPDLLVLDLNLPDSIGYETFQRIKSKFPDLSIFIMSIFGDETLASKAVAEGASDFLSKDYLTDFSLVEQCLKKTIERQEILTNLKWIHQRYVHILNSSADGIVVCDPQGQILFYNQTSERLLGEGSLSLGRRLPFEYRLNEEAFLTLNEPHSRTLSITANPCEWDQVQAICVTLRDFSERQSMIDALIAARKQADTSNQAKGAFLANMSHEMRTPLNGIMGAATLLADTSLNREQKDYVSVITQSSDFLLTLINDLLDLSRIEAGKLNVENTSFHLRELIDTCCDQFPILHLPEKVTFSQELPNNLPETVMGDPWRLRQILSNLLSNAFKFTQQGSVTLTVSLESPANAQNKQHLFEFKISDTGIGISKNDLTSLFTPFFQGDKTSPATYGGTGLGLAISKRLTHLMGGTLTVESSQGRGTTFVLRLPLIIAQAETASTNPSQSTRSDRSMVNRGSSLSARSMKFPTPPLVLIAEDHPINQKLVLKMLENMGCRVICANSGKEALERAAHTAVDLIFMDCQMPEMDGFDVTRHLRKLPQYELTPIIAMTALVFPADVEQCHQSGMSDVLRKPFRKIDLEEFVFKWLGTRADPPHPLPGELVDPELVKTWKELVPDEADKFEQEFLTLFFNTSRDFITETNKAIRAKDLESIKRLLHRFRGSAGHVGAKRLSEYLEATEKLITETSHIPPHLLSTVESEINELRHHFKFQPMLDPQISHPN